MKKLIVLIVVVALATVLHAQSAHALWFYSSVPQAPEKVRIATREIAPYVMREDHAGGRCLGHNLLKAHDENDNNDQFYCGYLVDILLHKYNIADSSIEFSVKRAGNANEMLGMLNPANIYAEQYTLGLANVTITDDRKEKVEFSDPIGSGGLGIMVKQQGSLEPNDFWLSIVDVFDRYWWGLVIVLTTLFTFAFIIWNVERKQQKATPRQKYWPAGYYRQIFKLATIFVSQGANGFPRSPLGCSLVLVWLIFAVLTITSFGVVMGSAFEARRTSGVATREDLTRRSVAVIDGTTGQREFMGNGPKPRNMVTVNSIEEAVGKLTVKDDFWSPFIGAEADAFVYDKPALEYYARHNSKGNFKVLDEQLTDEQYALVFPKTTGGIALRKEFDTIIAELTASGKLASLRDVWLKE